MPAGRRGPGLPRRVEAGRGGGAAHRRLAARPATTGGTILLPSTRTKETAPYWPRPWIAPVENRDLVDCDTGEWAGAPLKDLVKEAGVDDGDQLPERLSVSPGASPIRR